MEFTPTRQLIGSNPGGGYRRIARRVRDGELVRLRRGVVMPPADLKPHERLRAEIEATALVLRRGTWFSHRSAALLHELPVVVHAGAKVEVVRTMGGHGKSTARLHARAACLEPEDGVILDGLPVTSIERTTLDLARTLAFAQAVMVTDKALRLGVDRNVLLARVPPGRGMRMAERVLSFADAASESAGESESRALIALAGLPAPELQVPIYSESGEQIARPDFLWRAKKIIGEYDGEGKYTGEFGVAPLDAIRREKERQAALEDAGYLVLRWDKQVLRRPGELERRLRRALASRPWPLASGASQ